AGRKLAASAQAASSGLKAGMRSSPSSRAVVLALSNLLEHFGGLAERVIADRHAAIDRLLQDDLLDVVGGEAALNQRGAHVHTELLPPADRHHRANDENAPGALLEMRPRPDLAPGTAGNEI